VTKPLTIGQIRKLRNDASGAGDGVTVAFCDCALRNEVDKIDDVFLADLAQKGVVPGQPESSSRAASWLAELAEHIERSSMPRWRPSDKDEEREEAQLRELAYRKDEGTLRRS
jgi:hypothetical protein